MMVFGPRQTAPGEPWQASVKGVACNFPTFEEAQAWIEACRDAGHVVEGLGTPITWVATAASC
ncbi:hypothetical protein MKK67_18545 [Methylobacterium sp. J-072]|uniref:hypothetical protein n=1 Tax=Methylobacterium sp. J-072 TaxID=2836651 RepID=UPI001FBB60E3|nr:hypothetical protein [Methylobacterium sp. J-072]MCJ2094474.1 hypothetical protein [Methylobacterium sp. J-072]